MKDAIEVPVLIVGGGPVGLSMAAEPSHYGIPPLLVERNPTTTRHPKMDLTNGRTMDISGGPDLPTRFASQAFQPTAAMTSFGPPISSRARMNYSGSPIPVEYWRRRNIDDGTLALEAPWRVSQIRIEPIIREFAESRPGVEVRFSSRLESFTELDDHIVAVAVDETTGERQEVRAKYLAA